MLKTHLNNDEVAVVQKPALFSVVTVCKNCKDKLLRTAASVNNQNFADFEYIIKDGGSTDGTVDALKDIQATRIISEPDNGIFNAMNIALDFCSGEYIIFLNAGDVFCDDNVLNIVARDLRQNGEVDFLYGDMVSHQSKRKYIIYSDHLSRFFLYSDGICHQAWFVRRSVYFELDKFDDTGMIGDDYVFLLKSILGKRVKYRHVNYFVVEYEGSGISTNDNFIENSQIKRKRAREDMFHPLEFILYDFIIKLRGLLKRIIYDTLAFRFYKMYGGYRYRQQKYHHK